MKTHKGNIYLWFDGDTEKREFEIELRAEAELNQSALEVGAERNAAIMAEVLKRVRWSICLQNAKEHPPATLDIAPTEKHCSGLDGSTCSLL